MKKQVATTAFAAVALLCVQAGDARAQSDTTARRLQRQIDSLSALVAQSLARLDSVASAPSQAAPARAAGAYMNIGFDGMLAGGWSSNPRVRTLQVGDHDPHVRGFTIPQGEMSLDAVVDPYFKGFANIVHKIDEEGETGVELEELYFLTTSLPKGFQLKGGQFLTEFGRQNAQHPHAWSFVDQPLVINRMFGEDGMRGQGLRLSWLVPTPFYMEAMVTAMNASGGTMFSFLNPESAQIHGGTTFDRPVGTASDLVYVPRLTGSFDPTENTTLLWGASAAVGPNNAGVDTRSVVYGGDLYWKWKSARAAAGFPFVSFQAEAMARRYGTDARPVADDPSTTLPDESLRDQGGYVEALWGIKPRLVLGMRAERVTSDPSPVQSLLVDERADRTRLSPNFTWYPTEFSRVRFQYNHDAREGFVARQKDNSLWVQFEFIMGAHAAHKF
jgi:hypothetical protein